MEDNTIFIAAEHSAGSRSAYDEAGTEQHEPVSGLLAFYLSFVFGMLGAMAFLGEQIPVGRWIGIGLILAGAALISR